MPLEFEDRSRLKKFFNALEDKSIDPSSPYYLPFLENSGLERPGSDPMANLRNYISLSYSESVNLFSGQRGCGKSTEFARLKRDLEADGCVVFLFNMREYMNLTSAVEISDFLISIMIALSYEVKEQYGKDPSDTSYLDRLGDFLNKEVELKNIKIPNNIVDIQASLKDDPTFKQRLQESLKGHTARVVSDAHGFAQETVSMIRHKTKDADKKVVLLVDTVEQIMGVGADGSKEVHDSVQNLFSAHAASLKIPMLHIVYTIPPYLPALAPGLGRQLDAMVCTLPSIHVQNSDNSLDPKGLAIMLALIDKRYPQWQDFFTQEQLETLATASGGDLRNFFRLLRITLVKTNKLPIAGAVIEQSLNDLRRDMMPLANDDKVWLKAISENKGANLDSISKLPNLARFFDTNLVLNYRNGDDWYDVHPLLKDEINKP